VISAPVDAQAALEIESRDLAIRDRYAESLRSNPYQVPAFERVYESYLVNEGIDAWIAALQAEIDGSEESGAALITLARVHHRQFRTVDALRLLEQAKEADPGNPEMEVFLGRLYAEAGSYEKAAATLAPAANRLQDPMQLADACRLLGEVYMHLDDRERAIAAWRRLVELAPEDVFAWEELASVLEDNYLWSEAIAARRSVLERSEDDPYLQCKTWRAIGSDYERNSEYPGAIAAYENALDLASPANWLYEDVKGRLVSAYEREGDLEGLLEYLRAKIADAPADVLLNDLLADSLQRLDRFDEAERILHAMLERDSTRQTTYEELIGLYVRTGAVDKELQLLSQTIDAFPAEPDFIRRLGEAYLLAGDPEAAKDAWRRVVSLEASPEELALLAGWLERYEFPDEAVETYERAIAVQPDRDWVYRLAALKHEKGLEAEAVELWKSTIGPDSPAADCAEVASLLASHDATDDAIAMYARAIELNPGSDDARTALAKLLMNQDAYDRALEHFRHLADSGQSDYSKLLGERGMLDVYYAQGVLAEKQQQWEEEVSANPDAVEPRLRLARLYQRMGNHQRVAELYERCAELEPDEPEHLRALATVYSGLRNIDAAIATYERLTELDVARAGAYYRDLIQLYRRANQPEKAVAAAEKVVELAPSDAEARVVLAQTYLSHERVEGGLQQFRNALRLDPDDATTYQQYGDALARAERWGEAQETYRRMREAATSDVVRVEAVTRLASIYVRQERHEDLVREFEDRVRSAPKDLRAYHELAAVYVAAGDHANALDTMEAATAEVDDKEAALRLMLSTAHDANRLEKVVQAHERLIALSGNPTAYDWERLGATYAALGDLEKARAAWKEIIAAAPDDASAYRTVARAYSNWGYVEESMEARKRAIELDPTDYGFRLEYARLMASYDRIDEALAELMELLELSQWEDESSQTAQTPSPGQPVGPSRGFMAQARYYGYGRSLRSMSSSIIRSIVELSRRTENLDTVLAEIEKRAQEIPGNLNVQQDLLEFYTLVSKPDEAIRVARSIAETQPENLDLRWRLAELLAEQREYAEAESVYRAIAAQDSQRALQSEFAIARLYQQQNETDKARELVDRLVEENPENTYALQMAVQVHRNGGNLESVERLYARLMELDPNGALNHRLQFARYLQERGEVENARAQFEAVLFAKVPQQGAPSRPIPAVVTSGGSSGPMYAPDRNRFRHGGSNDVRRLTQYVPLNVNPLRSQALSQMIQMTLDRESLTPVVTRLQRESEACFTAKDPAEKAQGLELLIQYLCYLDYAERYEDAAGFAARLREGDPDEIVYASLELYFLHRLGDFDAMATVYDEIERGHPALAQPTQMSRMQLALVRGDRDEAIRLAQEIASQGIATQAVQTVAQQLISAGERGQAIAILEKQLAGSVANQNLVQMLVNAYSGEDEDEKAIEWARRYWDRTVRSAPAASPAIYGGRHSGRSPTDQAFDVLLRAYSHAGRQQELLAEFRERLAKQPNSTTWRECLIKLYQSTGKSSEAVTLYEELTALRPNSTHAKTELAQFLMDNNRAGDAIAIYEELLRTQPQLYFTMHWQIRQAYKQTGRQEKLTELEEHVVERATSADQLQRVAQQWLNDGEYERAAEAFERALKMDPNQHHLYLSLASAYESMEDAEKAIATIEGYLALLGERQRSNPDFSIGERLVRLYGASGRSRELKDSVSATVQEHPEDLQAQCILVEIAKHEKRYDEAMTVLEGIHARQPNTGTLREMVEVATLQGDFARAVQLSEEQLIPQGFRDWDELAELYVKAGDRAKAIETWQRKAAEQGGSWAHVEVLRNIIRIGMADEAVEFYRQARTRPDNDEHTLRQLDSTMVEMAGRRPDMREFIEREVLAQEGEWMSDIVRNYLYQTNAGMPRVREVLGPLLEARPDDARLLSLYGEFLGRYRDADELEKVYRRLVAIDPDNTSYMSQYAHAVANAGRPIEAMDAVVAWVKEKPGRDRISILANFANVAYRHGVDVFALRDQILALSPEAERVAVAAQFASSVAYAGDPQWAHDALKRHYEEDPGDGTLNTYFAYLIQWAHYDEAADLARALRAQDEHAWMRLQPQPLIECLLIRGDVTSVEDFVAALTLNPNSRGSVIRAFKGYLGTRSMALRLEQRLLESDSPSPDSLLALVDVFGQLDDHRHALSLAKVILERDPQNHQAAFKMFEILQRLRDDPEYLSEIEHVASSMEDAGFPATPMLVDMLVRSERFEEAESMVDSIPVSPGQPHQSVERARQYLRIGIAEKALADFESAGEYAEEPQVLPYRIQAFAMAGKTDEAESLLRERGGECDRERLFRALIDAKLYALAVESFKSEIEYRIGESWLVRQYAGALVKSNPEGVEWRDLFRRLYESTADHERQHIPGYYASVLEDNNLTESLMQSPDSENDRLAQLAIANVLQRRIHKGDETAKDTLRAVLTRIDETDPETLLLTGSLWRSVDDDAALAERYRLLAAHPDATDDMVRQAAQILKDVDPIASASAFLRLLEMAPRHVLRVLDVYKSVAACGDDAIVRQFAERVSEVCAVESQAAFARAYINYHSGSREAGIEEMVNLAADPSLDWESSLAMAKLLEAAGQRGAARTVYERLASGGCPRHAWQQALDALGEIAADAGDAGKAFATFVQMPSSIRMKASRLWRFLCTQVPLDTLHDMVMEAVSSEPGNDRVSDLLLLYGDALRLAGRPTAMDGLVAEMKVEGREKLEALQLAGLIPQWTISDAYELTNGFDSMKEDPTAEITAMMAPGMPLAGMAGTWHTPDLCPGGIVWVERVVGMAEEDTGNHAAIAIADVTCPAGAEVTFSHGSDDWVRIWVNGQKVHENLHGRALFPDQDRFTALLAQGQNRITIEIANDRGDWGFCLGMVDAPPGTTVTAPDFQSAGE